MQLLHGRHFIHVHDLIESSCGLLRVTLVIPFFKKIRKLMLDKET